MMKNAFLGIGLALSCVSGVAGAQTLLTLDPVAAKPKPLVVAAKDAATQATARKAIAAQYTSVEKATAANKLPGVMKVIAPDFQYFDTTGRVTDRVGYEGLQAETLKRSTKVRYTYTIKSITWRGADAVVMVESRFQGVYNRKNFDLRTKSRDFWSPTANGWLVRQRVDIDIRGFINGVKVDYNPLFQQPPSQPQVVPQPGTVVPQGQAQPRPTPQATPQPTPQPAQRPTTPSTPQPTAPPLDPQTPIAPPSTVS